MHHHSLLRLSRYFVAAVPALAAPAFANTYTVGAASEFGCGYTTIQAAINAAAAHVGPDTVLVSDTLSYTDQQLIVADSAPLTLRGGYSTCLGRPGGGRTVLRGTGAQSVLLTAPGTSVDLILTDLELRGGGAAYGAGIRHIAAGRVTIERSVIRANIASGSGGGIAMYEPAGAATGARTLVIGSGVVIGDANPSEGNQATQGYGGGLYIATGTLLFAGSGSAIVGNTAANGAGLALIGTGGATAVANIGSGGIANGAVLAGNMASGDGGAIFARGDGAKVQLITTDAQNPLAVSGNSAAYGGAFALYDNAEVRAWNTNILYNTSLQSGAVAYTYNGGQFALLHELAGAPMGAVACAAGLRCNRVESNAGGPYGAAIAFQNSSSFSTVNNVTLVLATLRGNSGAALFTDSCTVGQSCSLTSILYGSEISGNDIGALTRFDGGSYFTLDECTVAGNSGAGALFQGSRSFLGLGRSILWQPGRDVIGDGNSGTVSAGSLLVHDISDFPADPGIRNADPRFIDAAAGDYRLGADSPALDVVENAASVNVSLDGGARVVDLPDVPNLAGPLDLGAYERPLPIDLVFRNGFEDASGQ